MKNHSEDLKKKLNSLLLKVQKPARYIGGEVNSIVKSPSDVDLSFAFCFPDIYEIGMSHLGLKIIYSLINSRAEYSCERCFMPSDDMECLMRQHGIPLYSLENMTPLRNFDILGFTLQYELSYTSILAMLDLSGIPICKSKRVDDEYPLIIAGGACACNPEPLRDFFDIFVIGEGEEVTLELLDLFNKCKKEKSTRAEFLCKAKDVDGVFVPESPCKHNRVDTQELVTKRIVLDLDKIFFPQEFIVPFVETVHDRAVTEVLRGCIRGCRFCQAGFICKPYREKSRDKILTETKDLCENTGYDEISLCSLSTSDYSNIEQLLEELTKYTDINKVNLALPSLRIDKFNNDVLERIKSVRKSTLTFAPEAGTQRLRDVINKNITEENIMEGCRVAFWGGYSSVKLYFMLGLPTETDSDIAGIYELVTKIMRLYKQVGPNRGISISISLATFVPKPFTPFQFEPMITREVADQRQKLLISLFEEGGHKIGKSRKVKISRSNYDSALLEAVLARGDARLGNVIHAAWKRGCKLDSWGEHFDFNKWKSAFDECNVDMIDIACRRRNYDEKLPWEYVDMLVSPSYLIRENKLAHEGKTTPNCREKCSGCGIACKSATK